MPLVGAGVRIEDDHAMVDVAIGNKQLVRVVIHDHVRGAAEIRGVVAALALSLPPDLHQELSGSCELQNLCVLVAAAAEPDIVSIVYMNAVLELRPLVPGCWTAPKRDEGSLCVEFKDGRRGLPDRSCLVRLQRRWTMRDPDVIAPIDCDADDRADEPVVRQRPRPERIDAKFWSDGLASLPRFSFIPHQRHDDCQNGKTREATRGTLEQGCSAASSAHQHNMSPIATTGETTAALGTVLPSPS